MRLASPALTLPSSGQQTPPKVLMHLDCSTRGRMDGLPTHCLSVASPFLLISSFRAPGRRFRGGETWPAPYWLMDHWYFRMLSFVISSCWLGITCQPSPPSTVHGPETAAFSLALVTWLPMAGGTQPGDFLLDSVTCPAPQLSAGRCVASVYSEEVGGLPGAARWAMDVSWRGIGSLDSAPVPARVFLYPLPPSTSSRGTTFPLPTPVPQESWKLNFSPLFPPGALALGAKAQAEMQLVHPQGTGHPRHGGPALPTRGIQAVALMCDSDSELLRTGTQHPRLAQGTARCAEMGRGEVGLTLSWVSVCLKAGPRPLPLPRLGPLGKNRCSAPGTVDY